MHGHQDNEMRPLTSAEMDEILSFVVPKRGIPADTARSVADTMKRKLRGQLEAQRVYPSTIPDLTRELQRVYHASQVQPGECVGVVAAQSIGEKQTQTTLNSVTWGTEILYTRTARGGAGREEARGGADLTCTHEPIGRLVDALIRDHPESVLEIAENRTEYLSLTGSVLAREEVYRIPSCDAHGVCAWRRIEAVTRHLPCGRLVRIRTMSGRTVTVTRSKSLLVWDPRRSVFVPVEGSKVVVGDCMPTAHTLRRAHDNGTPPGESRERQHAVPLDTPALARDVVVEFQEGWADGTEYARRHGRAWDSGTDAASRAKAGPLHAPDARIEDRVHHGSTEYVHGFTAACILHLQEPPRHIRHATSLEASRAASGYTGDTDAYHRRLRLRPGTLGDGTRSLLVCALMYTGVYTSTPAESEGSGEDPGIDLPRVWRYDPYRDGVAGSTRAREDAEDGGAARGGDGVGVGPPGGWTYVADICLDPIVSVEHVDDPTCPYVYDLTVETTRNFQLYNGLNVRDTFHKAGQSEKTMTVGVPRFQQLINATKKPDHVNHRLYFTEGNTSIQKLRRRTGHSIVGLTLRDLCERIDLRMHARPEPWYAVFDILYGARVAIINPERHALRLTLKIGKLYEHGLDMQTVTAAIEAEYSDLQCICSPLHLGLVDVYPSLEDIELPENRTAYYGHADMVRVYMEESVQTELEKLYVCGVPGVTEVFYTRDRDAPLPATGEGAGTGGNGGEGEAGTRWCLETNAYDSHQIAARYSSYKKLLTLPWVDFTRTVSSNVWDIYEVLGVEAARMFLIEEFMLIMEGINDCHARLLVDRMTFNGCISSITRFTLKREQSGVLGKASFEESMDHFLNAAAAGEKDTTRGVSASIICGKRAEIGTGMFDMRIDLDSLPESLLI